MKLIKYLLLIPLTSFAIDFGPNSSYLSNTTYQSTQYNILGNKNSVIKQNYEDRMRNYNLYQTYGLNDLNSQYNYYNSMEGFHSDTFKDIYHTAYFNAFNPYIHNLRSANEKGEISDSVQVMGGAAEVLTGNANTFKLSENTKVSTKTDIPNQYGEVKLSSKTYNFFINYNLKNPSDRTVAGTLGTERLQTGLTKKLPYDFTESITYGATTQVIRNTVGYELITHVGLFYDQTLDNNINESVIRSGYGIKF